MVQSAMVKGMGVGGFLLLAVFASGCRSFQPQLPPLPPNTIKPVIAVTEFENETGFSGQWKLGRGIPDLLVVELMNTHRVILVDRKNLGDVLGEIKRQGHDLFRKEDSVARGRLKNARYLIRGVITDFTQTGSSSAWFKSSKAAGGITGARAMIMINLTLTDVETGEIISCVPAEGSAKASGKWARFDYNGVAFGGDLFFRTPIGQATQEAIRKAVYRLAQDIPYTTWKARVADATAETVIINGGENVGVQEGDLFDVREEGRSVTDPGTGNTIDHIAGKVVARIKITEVRQTVSDGIVLSGRPRRGYYLEKVTPSIMSPK
ncbi:MAG: CsgG/HfaB family protein [Verrucomicrobia bacterium]|nr:CsgG/HfaB family protein [Verrucomicrobiota bacterium]MCG2681837.1 CsgG/HfaB family protein [Kiritimatiellia bacterium]MBU4247719.1 CsgG/HfaB family protein [Verrucomicrobiota bacterium]MBU4291630.1 CsgG/HfaB family protein [Verrucomicrobiota bacterium]MBU4429553.1 CsgG/HfaB family protein [Verrucomicrobiota bacterium]